MKRCALSFSAPVSGTAPEARWPVPEALPAAIMPIVCKPSRTDVFPYLEAALEQFLPVGVPARDLSREADPLDGTASPAPPAAALPEAAPASPPGPGRSSIPDMVAWVRLDTPVGSHGMSPRDFTRTVLAGYRELLSRLSTGKYRRLPPQAMRHGALLGYCIPKNGMLHHENGERILMQLGNRDVASLSSTCRSAYVQLRPRRARALVKALCRDLRAMSSHGREPVTDMFVRFLRMVNGFDTIRQTWPASYDDALLLPLPQEVKIAIAARMLFFTGFVHPNSLRPCTTHASGVLQTIDPTLLLAALQEMMATREGQRLLIDANRRAGVGPGIAALVAISENWTAAQRVDLQIWIANLKLALRMVPDILGSVLRLPTVATEEPLIVALERMLHFQAAEAKILQCALDEFAAGGPTYEGACLQQILKVLLNTTQFALANNSEKDWVHESVVAQVRKLTCIMRIVQIRIAGFSAATRAALFPSLLGALGSAASVVLRQQPADARPASARVEKLMDPGSAQNDEFALLTLPSCEQTDLPNRRLLLAMLGELCQDVRTLTLPDAATAIRASLEALIPQWGLQPGHTHLQRLLAQQN